MDNKNCVDCLNCKVKKRVVRCDKDVWTDFHGNGGKTYKWINTLRYDFFERMRTSVILLATASTCPFFDSMVDNSGL